MNGATFSIPHWAEFAAVAVGSVQGAAYASGFRERRIDLFGVAFIGVATGLGGGFLRDVSLGQPLVALSNNWYIPVAIAAALVGMLLAALFTRIDPVITALDALTLGLFGAIGTTKAIALGLPEIPAAFVGMLAAVGGGMLRDILLNMPIAVMHVGSLYAVAAAAGTLAQVGLHDAHVSVFWCAAISTAVTFAVRLIAVAFGWSLPEQRTLTLNRVSVGFGLLRRRQRAPREYTTATGAIPTYKVVPRSEKSDG
ncbi:trimeric intracellular cation channel family protein [Gryllotalpicola reticulitermitis]|uniref:Trimeric intracellular cation channel family protein n=1 Tax=Gryllotalpicola reticulitermitis TaxID=1184153 RepID=A0ABV8Q9S8_9MICO